MINLFILLLALIPAGGFADTDISSDERSRRALALPMPAMPDALISQFNDGRSLFNQMWVIAPSTTPDIDGLGPLFNSLSCLECHPGNGRGRAPDSPGEPMRSMLVRLSVTDDEGNVWPHPIYGEQLQERAIPGVPAEGRAQVHYEPVSVTLADGIEIELRRPTISLTHPGYGEFGDVLLSGRIGPPLIGMGLIDAISDDTILQWVDYQSSLPEGIVGRPHWLQAAAGQPPRIGRFGVKAGIATLERQIAQAFHEDLGITSAAFPRENCTAGQTACLAAPSGGDPELTEQQLAAVNLYLSLLAIPEPAVETEQIRFGRQQFAAAACIHCHRPAMTTAKDAVPALLANRQVNLYSDLLLHDMGPDLADHRPEADASGSEWRTAPLWGLGLAEQVADRVGYLHDGRARTVLEAILWHGGAAQASRDAVIEMSTAEREALLAFLQSP